MNFENSFKKLFKFVAADWERQIAENFRTQSFYGNGWKGKSNYPGSRQGKTLYRDGDLQNSVQVNDNLAAGTISASSYVGYATIHNQGGKIAVIAKMKKFFWAMYYKSSGAVSKRKDGKTGNNKRNAKLTAEAEYWKAMALMKVGATITIPQRQFVGYHADLKAAIEKRANEVVPQDLTNYITSVLKQKK